ncbi:MAG TPA: hypothetical protein VFV92_09210 [Candidatus Bathyarchaeia archaeon]|nr:hypothetical protein [Candidatus Bathyarchaeia archaeon]
MMSKVLLYSWVYKSVDLGIARNRLGHRSADDQVQIAKMQDLVI